MNFVFLIFLLIIATASGCATVRPPTIFSGPPLEKTNSLNDYEFTGRIAVKQEEKGEYGNIHWIKHGVNGEVILFSPLGQQVANIRDEGGQVTLTLADRRTFHAKDAETLTQEVLGYSVPIKGLNNWLLGKYRKDAPAEKKNRPDGLLDELHQDGWVIRYADYVDAEGYRLPRRIVLNRSELEIRLVIDQWILK